MRHNEMGDIAYDRISEAASMCPQRLCLKKNNFLVVTFALSLIYVIKYRLQTTSKYSQKGKLPRNVKVF